MNDAQYGFVQFKTTKGAQTVLQHSEYRFGTVVLNVVAAKPWHQPDCPSKFKQMLNNTDNIRITQNNCNFPIRTLYVTSKQPIVSVTIENKKKTVFRFRLISFVQFQAIQQIRNHFEEYDDVEYFRWHSINGFDYGFVQFKDAESAEGALSHPDQICENVTLKIVAAQKHIQFGSKNINTLDDDCLKHVFSYLDIAALTSVTNVCIRFEPLAHETISSIQIASADNRSIIDLIIKYCRPTCLKELEIKTIIFSKELMQCLRPLFETLQKLHLIDCKFIKGSEAGLPTTMKLEDLRVTNNHESDYEKIGPKRDVVNSLLKLNKDVKKLDLGCYNLERYRLCVFTEINYRNLLNFVED